MNGPTARQWLGGLGAAAFVTVMVLLWRNPDVVSQMRSWGAESVTVDCDLAAGPCEAAFADGSTVALGIGDTAVVAGVPLPWVVESGAGDLAFMEISGLSMNMGLSRVPLEADGEGRWAGRASLPVCTSLEMRWRADVVLDQGVQRRIARFDFTSTGRVLPHQR